MAAEIKIEVASRETIKPSSPTPEEVNGTVKLSLSDQLCPVLYVTALLFYPGEGEGDDNVRAQLVADKSWRLKSSLSNVLTRYFPLAGRIRDNFWIDCNDEGAAYIEAEVNCALGDVLGKPDPAVLKRLFPVNMESTEAASGLLLLMQANFFKCGGLAIGIAISHKLCDASTMSSFIKAWTGMARGSVEVLAPDFAISSLIPPLKHLVDNLPVAELPKGLCVTRRYVFDSSRIAALKARATRCNEDAPEPSRVEAVSALIWKCAGNASRRNLGAPSRRTVLSQAVNLRKRLMSPLPEHSIGNFLGSVHTPNDDPEAELHSLVNNLRAYMKDYLETYPIRLEQGQENAMKAIFEAAGKFGSLMNDESIDFYNCSSWCNLQFYEADFGWGNPIWMSLDSTEFKNSVVLLDARDGEGIEVWLTLRIPDMAELDHDKELLEFASLNPSVTW
ncbi:BAHD acyltransferase At5g47980-like [Punica granatum]|uniref:Uncharacterized protein n=2 Tax=Punica granatum TaxID=22663 RepID=A0A218WTK0_PUNGR|nr:BAHD acyltransferase At5g47980-like [Punica granatum]OWM76174.1 hypothetical protein CDL15_Pgr009820 [Punica granatum]PKI77054.1 hypothetical protein CRG98_002557 [Punica granatum]